MTIDIRSENLILFSDLPKHIPGRPHISTCYRFRLHGSHGVKLETIKVGGRRFTSLQAIDRFIKKATAAADGATVPPTESNRAREQRLKRVDAELQAAGLIGPPAPEAEPLGRSAASASQPYPQY